MSYPKLELNNDEFVFNNDISNNIISGGYNVNSLLLKSGFSPIKTLNNNNYDINKSNNVSDIFSNLVIPNWIYKSPNLNNIYGGDNDNDNKDNKIINGGNKKRINEEVENIDIIDDDLHDKLLNLVKHYNPREKLNIKSSDKKEFYEEKIKEKQKITKKNKKVSKRKSKKN
jgi:hypothetical protein